MTYTRNKSIDFPMEMLGVIQSNSIKLKGDNNVFHRK